MRLADDRTHTEQFRVMEVSVKSIILAEINIGPVTEHHGRTCLAVTIHQQRSITLY